MHAQAVTQAAAEVNGEAIQEAQAADELNARAQNAETCNSTKRMLFRRLMRWSSLDMMLSCAGSESAGRMSSGKAGKMLISANALRQKTWSAYTQAVTRAAAEVNGKSSRRLKQVMVSRQGGKKLIPAKAST